MILTLALLPACDDHTLKFDDTGDPLACGPGTHEENGLCVPDAEADTDTDTDADTDTDVENQAPSAPTITITPEDPTQLSELSCVVTGASTDPDGDDVTYRYAWFVHGVESSITDAVVPDSATVLGDEWTCRVTASDGALDSTPAEASVTLARGYDELSLSMYHGCGVSPENRGDPGQIVCWGEDAYGEGSPDAGDYAHVATGYYETCALDADGALSCWGTVSWGMDRPPAGTYTDMALGWYGAYALDSGGALTEWGYVDAVTTPGITQVAGGEYDYCALDSSGAITCWGVNPNGEGDPPAGTYTALSGGYHTFCALDTAGIASCWGLREQVTSTPNQALTALSAYDGGACGLRADTSVLCWGDETLEAGAPAGAFSSVAVGGEAACVLDSEGRATCWGDRASAPPSF